MLARLERGCIAMAFTARVAADACMHRLADAVEGGEKVETADEEEGDEDSEAPLPVARVVAAVTKHQRYAGARPGCLDSVWFGIKYTDGSATGRRGEVEAPTILIRTAEGRAALLRYAATKKGKSVAKYLPARVSGKPRRSG